MNKGKILQVNGAVIDVGNEAVVVDLLDDGFVIRQLGKDVRVKGDTKGVKRGEYVILQAKFHKPGRLEANEIRIAKKRRSKIVLSIFPAIFIIFYFLKKYRFSFHDLYFEER